MGFLTPGLDYGHNRYKNTPDSTSSDKSNIGICCVFIIIVIFALSAIISYFVNKHSDDDDDDNTFNNTVNATSLTINMVKYLRG